MKLVFASDSFKGTLTSEQTSELLYKAAHEVIGECETISVNVADGGEGTIDAVIKALNGTRRNVNVHDPLNNIIPSYYGRIDDTRAIIEMAPASGLTLIPEDKRNPRLASSYGTGELVRDALLKGARDIIIAIGGSATNDGGMGFARALGIEFYDKQGKMLEGRGEDLINVYDINMTGLMTEAKAAHFTVMCDVTNPLCGSNGATYTYGRQKGASDSDLEFLEKGMQNYRDMIIEKFGKNVDEIAGSGAAGGMGAALSIYLNAEMKSGIEAVLDVIGFDTMIKDADYIITGEGRADIQSTYGKVVSGIGKRGLKYGITVVALCGSLGDGYEKLYDHGVKKIVSVSEGEDISKVLESPAEYYYKCAVNLFIDLFGK